MDLQYMPDERGLLEIQRDIDHWYSLRWDILALHKSILFIGKPKREVTPNLAQLDKDLEILAQKGPEVLFEIIIIQHGGLSGEYAGYITRIMKGGNAFFELMGRRCEAHKFNSDDLVKVENSIWFKKQIEEDIKAIDRIKSSGSFILPAITHAMDQFMKGLCSKRWEDTMISKNKFNKDFEMLNLYRGRQELVRDILIKQGGYPEVKADREMYDRPYASRVVIEIMKKSRSFLAAS